MNLLNFEVSRIIHILLAFLFIYILTPLLPLTAAKKKLHRFLGWLYIVLLLFLVIGGYQMDSILFILSLDNISALINIFLRNFSILVFCLLGVVPLIPLRLSWQGHIFRLFTVMTGLSGLTLLIYGLFTELLKQTANRAAPLLPIAHIHPSYVMLGGFFVVIAIHYLNGSNYLNLNRLEKIKVHRRHMGSALFLSMLNPLTVEINKYDIFHNDSLYLALVLIAVIYYAFDYFGVRRLDVKSPDKLLSGLLMSLVIFSTAVVLNLKSKPMSHLYYGVKMISHQIGGKEHARLEDKSIAGCRYFPRFIILGNERKGVVRLIQCTSALALREVMNEAVIQQGDTDHLDELQMKSVNGIGGEATELAARSYLFPLVLVNFANNNGQLKKEVKTNLTSIGCSPFVDFRAINYFEMLAGTDQMVIYQCPEIRKGPSVEFKNLMRHVIAINGSDARASVVYSKPKQLDSSP